MSTRYSRRSRLTSLALTLGLAGVNLIAFNYLLHGCTSTRLDLTEEGIYSISPATRSILDSLEEDVIVRCYFSKRTHSKLAPLVPAILDLLDEYRAVSGGRVQVEVIDPGDDDELSREAADRFGVQSTPFRLESKFEQGIVNAYFAVVIQYGDQYERYSFSDLIEIEPLPGNDIEVKLRNLEYDVTRAIKKVAYGFRGASELFARLDEPVTLHALISPSSIPDLLADVPAALRAAGAELEEKGGDKFRYLEADPNVDVNAKTLVDTWGLPPLSVSLFGEEGFYLYAILQTGDRLEQIVLTGDDVTPAGIREAVEDALRRSTPGFLKTIGLVIPAPVQLPPQLQMRMGEAPREFEELQRYLEEDAPVREVDLGPGNDIPSDIDVLLVVKPEELSDDAVYQLDQYLMRGGRMVLCAGRYASSVGAQGLVINPVTTGLEDWLRHFGVEIEPTLLLDDRNRPLPIPSVRNTALGPIRSWTLEPYPYLVEVSGDGLVDRAVTSTLDSIGLYWASPLSILDPTPNGPQPKTILRSSERSWTDDNTSAASQVGYSIPDSGLGSRPLAVELSGKFSSYFVDQKAPSGRSLTLTQSPETRMVVIGNADFLNDFVARTLQQMEGGFFVNNLRLVQNTLDWVTQDQELASIRSRGLISRRLDASIEPAQRSRIEVINYLIPLVWLAALAAWMAYRRRKTRPIVGPGGRS